MQADTETPEPDPMARNHAPRIMVWHIRTPVAVADETLNRVILPTTNDDESWAGTEINAGAPVL